jgi:predicted TIM-barrel fold metal-dependent hydrolase
MDLSAIPILDHHCHVVRRPGVPLDGDGLRRAFVETTDAGMAPYVRSSVFYMRALRDLAALLDCAPDEDAVLAARGAAPFEGYARRLFDTANFERLLIDTGLRMDDGYDAPGMADLAGRPAAEVLRLESLMERLIAAHETLAQVEEAMRAELRAAPGQGVVAFKSIAAYRGGLHVAPRTAEEAAAGLAKAREQALSVGRLRLSERRLLDYLLRAALEEAAATALPVQFHVAFGDDDADLRTAGPLHLRPLLQDPALRPIPFVLLHCYPYVREAGYLAALYGNVFVDLSLTVPLTAHGAAAAFSEVLELAPVGKVLFATDAHSIPELYFIGALHGRRALGRTLERLVAEDMLTAGQAEQAAMAILRGNAARLYGFGT